MKKSLKIMNGLLATLVIGGTGLPISATSTMNVTEESTVNVVTDNLDDMLEVPVIEFENDKEEDIVVIERESADVDVKSTKNNAISVIFPDPVLAQVIADMFKNTGVDDIISQDDLDKIQVINASIYDNRPSEIRNLTGIERLTNLRELTLNGQRVETLDALQGLTKLQVLSLQHNNVIDLNPIAGMKNLEELYLTGNNLASVQDISTLKSLRVLDLTANRIIDISPLAGMTSLQMLYLSDNRIDDITPLRRMKNLHALFLDGNRLTDIRTIKDLKKLTQLTVFEQTIINPSMNPTSRVTIDNKVLDEFGAPLHIDRYLIDEQGTYDDQLNVVSWSNTTGLERVSYRFESSIEVGGNTYSYTGLVIQPLTGKEDINTAPTIKATDKVLTIGDAFNPKQDVEAIDLEDGALPVEVVKNTVDTTEVGIYFVEYRAVDSKGLETKKKITVSVHPVYAPKITLVQPDGQGTKVMGESQAGYTVNIVITTDLVEAPTQRIFSATDNAAVYTAEVNEDNTFDLSIPMEYKEGNTFGIYTTRNNFRSVYVEYRIIKDGTGAGEIEQVVDRVDHIEAGSMPIVSGETMPGSAVTISTDDETPAKTVKADHNGFWTATLNGYVRHQQPIHVVILDVNDIQIVDKTVLAMDTIAPGNPNLVVPLNFAEGKTHFEGISEPYVSVGLILDEAYINNEKRDLLDAPVVDAMGNCDNKTGKWDFDYAGELVNEQKFILRSEDEAGNTSEFTYTVALDSKQPNKTTPKVEDKKQSLATDLPATGENIQEKIVIAIAIVLVSGAALIFVVRRKRA